MSRRFYGVRRRGAETRSPRLSGSSASSRRLGRRCWRMRRSRASTPKRNRRNVAEAGRRLRKRRVPAWSGRRRRRPRRGQSAWRTSLPSTTPPGLATRIRWWLLKVRRRWRHARGRRPRNGKSGSMQTLRCCGNAGAKAFQTVESGSIPRSSRNWNGVSDKVVRSAESRPWPGPSGKWTALMRFVRHRSWICSSGS